MANPMQERLLSKGSSLLVSQARKTMPPWSWKNSDFFRGRRHHDVGSNHIAVYHDCPPAGG